MSVPLRSGYGVRLPTVQQFSKNYQSPIKINLHICTSKRVCDCPPRLKENMGYSSQHYLYMSCWFVTENVSQLMREYSSFNNNLVTETSTNYYFILP